MSNETVLKEIESALSSLNKAATAARESNWAMVEQGVAEAQERGARVLQEVGMKLVTEAPGELPVAPGQKKTD
jgi:vacuolar-type H+-ATPase subunit H